jgi:hypothetical protein
MSPRATLPFGKSRRAHCSCAQCRTGDRPLPAHLAEAAPLNQNLCQSVLLSACELPPKTNRFQQLDSPNLGAQCIESFRGAMPDTANDLAFKGVCSTGLAGLDAIINGGLPSNCFYLVQGDPGSGKTTLALQFLFEGRRRGEGVLYITLSEARDELERVAASHGWSLEGIPPSNRSCSPSRRPPCFMPLKWN